MKVTQIYELVNESLKSVLGQEDLLQEDLSNVVDMGTELFNANEVDNFVKTLVDKVGKVIFVVRKYSGFAPNVVMDSWEYGNVCQKIRGTLPQAVINESWQLEDGKSYDPFVFKAPSVSNKFFSNRVTFEVDISIAEKQVKSAFTSPTELNTFVSMLYNEVDKSMTIAMDNLVMRTINNLTATTLSNEFPSGDYGSATTSKAINLLYLYNVTKKQSLTVDECLTDMEFLKFASYTMSIIRYRLSGMSTLFNVGEQQVFTSSDMLHFITLADFSEACNFYLQSDTYHTELVTLPNHSIIPYWQGTGTEYLFDSISKIDIKHTDTEVSATGILAVMFDRDALGVSCLDRRNTAQYNAKGEFFNTFFKFESGYFNDTNENFVVFFVADSTSTQSAQAIQTMSLDQAVAEPTTTTTKKK